MWNNYNYFVSSRQIGAEAMRCDCPDGYVGHNCETRLLDTLDTGKALSQSDIFICFILVHELFIRIIKF